VITGSTVSTGASTSTVAVFSLVAATAPPVLVAVTTTRIVFPTSVACRA
jgi:hypothetical protein